MQSNYLQANSFYPFHISVGALIFNTDKKILCHRFNKIGNLKNIYTLMRESMMPGESLEKTFERGLAEEFGAEGTIEHFIGSVVAKEEWFGEIGTPCEVEKTTLYFLGSLLNLDETKREKAKPESVSEILFETTEFLIERMQDQAVKFNFPDLDESKIVIAAQKYI